jgi:hypothetical protein
MPRESLPANIVRDQRTIAAMLALYCRDHHGTRGAPCEVCRRLLDYSHGRLAKCPYGAEKTTCRECPIHCYRPAERASMRDVMRYAGPRMLWRHPLLALRHLWIERQGPPRRAAGKGGAG